MTYLYPILVIIEPFLWVLTWKDIIPLQHFVSLLEKHFFPKWFQVSERSFLTIHYYYYYIISSVLRSDAFVWEDFAFVYNSSKGGIFNTV